MLSVYFVTAEDCADRDAALDTMVALAAHLEERYRDDAILGFEFAVVATDDDYLEHDLTDQRAAIELVLGDRRPSSGSTSRCRRRASSRRSPTSWPGTSWSN